MLHQVLELSSKGPLYIVMVGPPGAGKSTLLKELQKVMPLNIVSSDLMIQDYARLHQVSYHKAAGKLGFKKFKLVKQQLYFQTVQLVLSGKHVAIDQPHMTRALRGETLKQAGSHIKVCVNLIVSEETAVDRAAKRFKETGRLVPDFIVRQELAKYEPPTLQEGFDYVISNTVPQCPVRASQYLVRT